MKYVAAAAIMAASTGALAGFDADWTGLYGRIDAIRVDTTGHGGTLNDTFNAGQFEFVYTDVGGDRGIGQFAGGAFSTFCIELQTIANSSTTYDIDTIDRISRCIHAHAVDDAVMGATADEQIGRGVIILQIPVDVIGILEVGIEKRHTRCFLGSEQRDERLCIGAVVQHEKAVCADCQPVECEDFIEFSVHIRYVVGLAKISVASPLE